MFEPLYRITAAMTRALMAIEADRQAVESLPMEVTMLASLRQTARLASTHYSTQIEGNRLTEAQVSRVLAGGRVPGRERDELEVRHYYRALEEVERLGRRRGPISESVVRRIHGLVMKGRAIGTAYRGGQNVIRDSRTGGIVYLPPEARDVSKLMSELVRWIDGSLRKGELPAPVAAGLAHYQFATIHPYYDGNGRTARLLTTLILHKTGYGLRGIYSLDAYYARNLEAYYRTLSVGPSHNYYMGRVEADVTGFLEYFCVGMAEAFGAVRAQAAGAAARGAKDQMPLLRRLDPRQRRLLELFQQRGTATTSEMANHLELQPRTLVVLCRDWVAVGFLALHDPSRKNRSYQLGGAYEGLLRP